MYTITKIICVSSEDSEQSWMPLMQYCLGGDPVYVGTSVGVFKVGASVTIHDI